MDKQTNKRHSSRIHFIVTQTVNDPPFSKKTAKSSEINIIKGSRGNSSDRSAVIRVTSLNVDIQALCTKVKCGYSSSVHDVRSCTVTALMSHVLIPPWMRSEERWGCPARHPWDDVSYGSCWLVPWRRDTGAQFTPNYRGLSLDDGFPREPNGASRGRPGLSLDWRLDRISHALMVTYI